MATKSKKETEVHFFYKEDGDDLAKILKQSFRTVILKQLQGDETKR